MSDQYSRLLTGYARSVSWDSLRPEVTHEVKRRIIDSIGVAMACFHSDAPLAARSYAGRFASPEGATLWGTASKAPPEMAAFTNGVMVRYLDFSDTYLSLEPLHPSDLIPGLFALAEWRRISPRRLIAAIAAAYEIGVNLCDAASLRAHRWDHVNYIAVAEACAASTLLGLDGEQAESALSIAVVPHAAMRQTRAGALSMWKGAAAANAARNAVFAALLAEQGMTGPYQPFEGEMGFFRQLLDGERFLPEALVPLGEHRPPARILDTYIKFWPVEYHAQSAVDAALQLRGEAGGNGGLAGLRIETFKAAYEIIARDPEKWAPETRETADHSLQYIVAAALIDGEVTHDTFAPDRLRDPRIRELLRKTAVEENAELTAGYPDGIPNRITIETAAGEKHTREVRYPLGHARNPMSDRQVVDKFLGNVAGVWSTEVAERVLDCVWRLDEQESLDDLLLAMRP